MLSCIMLICKGLDAVVKVKSKEWQLINQTRYLRDNFRRSQEIQKGL